MESAKWQYGRLSAGNEDSVKQVDAVTGSPSKESSSNAAASRLLRDATPDRYDGAPEKQSDLRDDHDEDFYPSRSSTSAVMKLPAELVDHIFSFLSPVDLAAVSATCRNFHGHALKELVWQNHVQSNVPGCILKSPAPYSTFRELYWAHDPHWFLSKYKIWFCDIFLTGMLIVIRYDPRRGCIEGYRLVAERKMPEFEPWEFDDEVIIHCFEPNVKLHMDQPILQLDAYPPDENYLSQGSEARRRKFDEEIPIRIHENNHGTFSNFLLARPVKEMPGMALWPPDTIPARHRVRNASQESFTGSGHKPQKRWQISDQTFRIRRWVTMGPFRVGPAAAHLGEEVYTYSTLDPSLYTPTTDKPYRGIWVGDYSAHGCEFLLMHQPDDDEPFDESAIIQRDDETEEEFSVRQKEERLYRGSIEAIKLTGDPNVPRGEYTFVADDIGTAGFVRVADEERFKGARIVKSRGHIAENMFRNDKFIESQLIMISPDKLAQYWVGFGHISFYERVEIDKFLSPS